MFKIPNDLAAVFETILWEMWKKKDMQPKQKIDGTMKNTYHPNPAWCIDEFG